MLLITGSNGQLGTAFSKHFPDAFLTTSTTLDITNADAVQLFVKENNVDTIINCAAYTAVDLAEENVELAAKVNIDGPRNLAQTNAKIIHFSTDYVFDGLSKHPYTENDPTHPQSVYGRTKLLGEQALLEHAQSAIVIRTSWLYSVFGNNFVKTIHNLASQKDTISVIDDQIGCPTCIDDLVKAVLNILPQFQPGKKDLYHFSNEGSCSWYDFAKEIIRGSDLNCQINPIPSKDYPTKAARPVYSVLDTSKIKKELKITIPHWKESLLKCLTQF